MRDVDRRRPESSLQRADLDAHLPAQRGVQVRERLVEEKRRGLAHHRAPHGDPLPLPAGELLRPSLEQRLDAKNTGCPGNAPRNFGAGELSQAQSQRQVLAYGHVRVERVVLEHHRDVALAWWKIRDVALADANSPCRRRLEAGEDAEYGRLARARTADKHEQLPVRDLEMEILDDGDVTEALRDVLERETGHGDGGNCRSTAMNGGRR